MQDNIINNADTKTESNSAIAGIKASVNRLKTSLHRRTITVVALIASSIIGITATGFAEYTIKNAVKESNIQIISKDITAAEYLLQKASCDFQADQADIDAFYAAQETAANNVPYKYVIGEFTQGAFAHEQIILYVTESEYNALDVGMYASYNTDHMDIYSDIGHVFNENWDRNIQNGKNAVYASQYSSTFDKINTINLERANYIHLILTGLRAFFAILMIYGIWMGTVMNACVRNDSVEMLHIPLALICGTVITVVLFTKPSLGSQYHMYQDAYLMDVTTEQADPEYAVSETVLLDNPFNNYAYAFTQNGLTVPTVYMVKFEDGNTGETHELYVDEEMYRSLKNYSPGKTFSFYLPENISLQGQRVANPATQTSHDYYDVRFISTIINLAILVILSANCASLEVALSDKVRHIEFRTKQLAISEDETCCNNMTTQSLIPNLFEQNNNNFWYNMLKESCVAFLQKPQLKQEPELVDKPEALQKLERETKINDSDSLGAISQKLLQLSDSIDDYELKNLVQELSVRVCAIDENPKITKKSSTIASMCNVVFPEISNMLHRYITLEHYYKAKNTETTLSYNRESTLQATRQALTSLLRQITTKIVAVEDDTMEYESTDIIATAHSLSVLYDPGPQFSR